MCEAHSEHAKHALPLGDLGACPSQENFEIYWHALRWYLSDFSRDKLAIFN